MDIAWPDAFASKPAPTLFCGVSGFCEHPVNLWEWACSRRGRQIQNGYRLSGRFREQARFHRVLRCIWILWAAAKSVGVGLLTKRPAHSTWISPDRTFSRASPLPQCFYDMPEFCGQPTNLWEWACSRRGRQIQNGYRLSGRFREQARSHRVLRCIWISWAADKPVGVGLLTKRPAHSTWISPDRTLSRASPLPQGSAVYLDFVGSG